MALYEGNQVRAVRASPPGSVLTFVGDEIEMVYVPVNPLSPLQVKLKDGRRFICSWPWSVELERPGDPGEEVSPGGTS